MTYRRASVRSQVSQPCPRSAVQWFKQDFMNGANNTIGHVDCYEGHSEEGIGFALTLANVE